MRGFLVLLLVCSAVCAVECSSATISSWICLAWHRIMTFNWEARCSLGQMQKAYIEMKSAECINCDKYFHCMGNYRAVYSCQSSKKNREMAETISNCREWGDNSSDSRADQAANLYGRYGGNCADHYLCNVNCKYNPVTDTCRKSNCP